MYPTVGSLVSVPLIPHMYKIYCRDLKALSVHPLLVYPTHYTGEEGYISDTEDTNVITHNQREKIEL